VPEPAALVGFLAAAAAVAFLWGRLLWYLDERSQAFRRWVLVVLGYTRRTSGEVRSLLLSSIYCLLGLLFALSFAAAFRLRPSEVVSFSPAHLGLAVLGILGEVSLANLFVGLGRQLPALSGPERFAELGEIPWMKGLRELPPAVVPMLAAFSGMVEETLFRGVLLLILTGRLGVAPWAAVAITGTLFCAEQLLQVRTPFQALVIGGGCAAISLVGGLLVVLTGSVVPAVLCHGSFVVFFMPRDGGAAQGLGPGRREAAAA
jgi:membrane protease YdiL (CAAX protease family)